MHLICNDQIKVFRIFITSNIYHFIYWKQSHSTLLSNTRSYLFYLTVCWQPLTNLSHPPPHFPFSTNHLSILYLHENNFFSSYKWLRSCDISLSLLSLFHLTCSFIHFAANDRISPFSRLSTFFLFVHPLMGTSVVSISLLLWIKRQWTWEYRHLFNIMVSIRFDIYSEVGLLHHRKRYTFNFLKF